MKKIFLLFLLTRSFMSIQAQPRELYQLTVYHYTTDSQGLVIEEYLRESLVPAVHRASVSNIGVFKAIANDTATDKRLYVFLPLKNWAHLEKLNAKLDKDQDFLSTGTAYRNALYNNPPYKRMEQILLKAFPLAPQMQLPQ